MLTITLTQSLQHYRSLPHVLAGWIAVPVNISLYQVKTSSSLISEGFLLLSTIVPSESMTRYVGIAAWVEGCSNASSVVNLLFTAPGKWTLRRHQQRNG